MAFVRLGKDLSEMRTGHDAARHTGDHEEGCGIHAAAARPALGELSVTSPGYHRSNKGRSVPSKA